MRISKRRRQKGQGLVEYALILVLVAVVVVGVVALLGEQIATTFCTLIPSLGGEVPDLAVCKVPHVECVGVPNGANISGAFSIEAIVTDYDGGPASVNRVEFFINDSPQPVEREYRYCLFGGNGSCGTATRPAGSYVVRALAYDTDGNVGSCTVNFTVS